MAPSGPYRLVTVNTAPERAKRLIGRVVEDVKDTYTIIHVANAESKVTFFVATYGLPPFLLRSYFTPWRTPFTPLSVSPSSFTCILPIYFLAFAYFHLTPNSPSLNLLTELCV